ncbi:MAG TPA: 4Fe-4S dicluster domain-containing protein [Anaeromyxobacter sp.]|nr:4Fe-4S dicluster domain-containing protein [Anaeromyxobacter sp.]
MTRSGRFRRWRRAAGAAQAAVMLGLPFVRVGGESALRLDVPAGRLHAFGASFAIDEAFVVLAAVLLVTVLFLLVTLLLGRVWCGWACPQTVLADLTSARRPLGRVASALVVSAVVSASIVWWFVSPYEFFPRLAAGALGPVVAGSWAALFAILFLDLTLLRARFCATACPYAKLQGVLFDRSTLVVAYDARRAADCVDCEACVRVCPTGIDIRHGLQTECIACAECADACAPIMAKLRRAPDLVGYFFGEPGGRARPLRPAALALGGGAIAATALLVAVVAARAVLDLSAVPEFGFAPRRAPDGRAVNAYSVALENHGRAPVTVALALSAPGADVALRPDRVALGPGERRQVRLVVTAGGLAPGRVQGELSAAVSRGGAIVERRTQRLALVSPEAAP